jgi:hypothetical protein
LIPVFGAAGCMARADATLAQGENISRVADMYRVTGDWHDCGPGDGPWGKLCPSNLTYHFQQA